MKSVQTVVFISIFVGIIICSCAGLDLLEGETITLTCPRRSKNAPIIWQGPPDNTQFSVGMDVNPLLPTDKLDRLSVVGDASVGQYNLQIRSVRKSDAGKYRCLIGSRTHRNIKVRVRSPDEETRGLFPYILNLAKDSLIKTNATCGEVQREYYCRLVEHVEADPIGSHCDYCDATDVAGRRNGAHPITNAIDGTNKWWQSPTLTNGWEYNYITITLDLQLIYNVAYVVIKAANAPRPGNWILEKSIDGVTFTPWQYFAITDEDCFYLYNKAPTPGKPTYDFVRDDEVVCTSYYSKLNPLENGEIFVSLTNGRPGVYEASDALLEFTSARFVRLTLQKIRTLNADLMTFRLGDPRNIDPSVTRRYFYSIKDISIGGQCICYGHAEECRRIDNSDRLGCICRDNTCGTNCERCCPLFNQEPWQRGGETKNGGAICEPCNCHNHADECVYNRTVADLQLSLNPQGIRSGGGVCIDCQDFTTGINCEKCLPGYYRPLGLLPEDDFPCRQCNCRVSIGSTGECVVDDSRLEEDLRPGDCVCRPGYGGVNCDRCAPGYHNYPNCEPCPCHVAGTLDPDMCEGRCVCKANVEGAMCDRCKAGFYNLAAANPDGCSPCFCFGVTNDCQSANLGIIQISDMRATMDGWTVITLLEDDFTLFPSSKDGWLEYRSYPSSDNTIRNDPDSSETKTIYFWQAPMKYYGSRLTSYGGNLMYTIKYTTDPSAVGTYHLSDVNVVLQGSNITITNNRNYVRETTEHKFSIKLLEANWHKMDEAGRRVELQHVSKEDFMMLLYDLRRILIRAVYHTGQDWVYLKDVVLETVTAGSTSDVTIPMVEKCSCPPGYSGTSCENCDPGWRRLNNIIYGGSCVRCQCNNHAKQCDPYDGRCYNCFDNTMGEFCDECIPGYYGDPVNGQPDDCKRCACPLEDPRNNFANECVLFPRADDLDHYVCLSCQPGYTGDRCDRCADGHFGFPLIPGNYCQPCFCNGNINRQTPGSCDQQTGECRLCLYNTEGPRCQFCRLGYYGTAINGDCKECDCFPDGSKDITCDRESGQCMCKEHYTGRRCDRCQAGYGNVMRGCSLCKCSRVGSLDMRCHPVTGQCICRPGITGLSCDKCQEGYFSYSTRGCIDCRCYRPGTNSTDLCDPVTGECNCLSNVTGERCTNCEEGHWGLDLGEGCRPCNCDPRGSYFTQCDSRSGQCRCKPGVTGLTCNQCHEGFYGLDDSGCKECKVCKLPGRICDQVTGECVCPPNTEGDSCERCVPHAWGYQPRIGCQLCNCDPDGSTSEQCNAITGQCDCRIDFNGTRCDACYFGLYGFPNCQLCLCSLEGTEPSSCDPQRGCRCAEDTGQCLCKKNTESRTCSLCKENTFSPDMDNPHGCTACFCFERGSRCGQASYVWSKITLPDREVSVGPRADVLVRRHPTGFYVIPSGVTFLNIPGSIREEPLYWSLPDDWHGDQTLSYGGDLSFSVIDSLVDYGDPSLAQEPLVVLVGHGIPLLYHSDHIWDPYNVNNFTVKLHPHYWRTKLNNPVTRKLMMIILQNVTDILVRASWDSTVVRAELTHLILDVAVPASGNVGKDAFGIEQCQCPSKYSGLSCQDPAPGYYRVLPDPGDLDFKDMIDVIGNVAECFCNSHSDMCDPDTGVCQNCLHNTAGDHCELCAVGYYGDPTYGTPQDCTRCACPLEIDTNNFSPTCEDGGFFTGIICTACETGYQGNRCERCAPGYFGDPSTPGERCEPCGCNIEGSVDDTCDYTGRCICLPGIMGLKCDRCQPRHAVVGGVCISCDAGCTRDLMLDLDDLDNMTSGIDFGQINVTYPWERLMRVENDTFVLKNTIQNLRFAALDEIKKEIENSTAWSDQLLDRSLYNLGNVDTVRNRSAQLKRLAEDVEKRINEEHNENKAFVEQLEEHVNQLFHNRSGINVTKALEEAKRILKEIRARDFSDDEQAAREENRLAEELSDRIHAMKMRLTDPSPVEKRLMDVIDALTDLQRHSNSSQNITDVTKEKLAQLKAMLENIRSKSDDIKDLNGDSLKALMEGEDLLNQANEDLDRTKVNTQTLEREVSTFDAAMVPLKDKEKVLRESLGDSERWVYQAQNHAANLSATALDLERQFEHTRKSAEDPLRAATVYKNIVNAIEEAEEAARKAIADVENATRIANVEETKKAVDISVKESQKLLDKATETSENITDLDNALRTINGRLDNIEDEQNKIRDDNERMKDQLDDIPQDFATRLSDVLDKVDSTNEKANKTKKEVDLINGRIDNELMPKLREIQNIHKDDYQDIKDTIGSAKDRIRDIENLSAQIDAKQAMSRQTNSDMMGRLNKLKQNIREARAEANKVKTSLLAAGRCVKSFRSPALPGMINTISFAFKTSDPDQESMLVLLQKSRKEYLAVELRNRRIWFSWNVGFGPGSVESDIPIIDELSTFKESKRWFRVIAQRIGRIGQLTVHSLADQPGDPVSGSSPIGASLMTLDANSDLYVAGVPDGYSIDSTLTRTNFTGCMGSLLVDDQPIGVYNFETIAETGCDGCLEVPRMQTRGANVYQFDGTGYAVTDQVKLIPMSFNIVMDFKTYWQNATLFFIGNKENGQYMSVELQDGHLVYKLYMGADSYVSDRSKQQYNINNWVSLQINRNGDIVWVVIDQKEELFHGPEVPKKSLYVPDSIVYFGGIPGDVNVNYYMQQSGEKIETTPFLGCMRNIQLYSTNINLFEAGKVTVGVLQGCKDKGYRAIGFYGEGFAEMPGASLDTGSGDISLSFSTEDPNVFLLLAKSLDDDATNGDSYYSLSLVDGKIEGRFNGGGGQPLILQSPRKFNDGQTHSIAVRKQGSKIDLFVDDQYIIDGQLRPGYTSIPVQEDGGLFLGGIPAGMNFPEMAASFQTITGRISDVVLNGKVLNINNPKQYHKADIGRCPRPKTDDNGGQPLPESTTAETMSASKLTVSSPTPPPIPTSEITTAGPQACADEVGPFGYEKDAFSFGAEALISFREIINVTKRDFTRRKFNISFDLRTYFDEGLLFFITNQQDTQSISAQLEGGKIFVRYRNGGKSTVESTNVVSDGQWHNVFIDKQKKKLIVSIDNGTPKSLKTPKNLDLDKPMYVGGVPDNVKSRDGVQEDNLSDYSIRGCLRSLMVNGDLMSFGDTTSVGGIGRCYRNVEAGVYFTGDSYGVYATNFRVGDSLEMVLEFRTKEQDGILFSVSNSDGGQAMTLQLHEGKVKLSVINDGGWFTAESTFDNQYLLCDSRWHRVRANVVKNVVTLEVDGQPPSTAASPGDIRQTKTTSPLFIGGFPDTSIQATAFTSNKLKGCLRNVSIQGTDVDWFNLVQTVGIHKTSCPVD